MDLTDLEIKRATQITSIFENGTIVPQYAYAERLADFRKRGVTFGLGTCVRMDGMEVLDEIAKMNMQHPILIYRDHFEKAMNSSLYNYFCFPVEEFISDWEKYGADEVCSRASDIVYYNDNIKPALDKCSDFNLTNFWSFVSVFDCVVMCGIEMIDGIVHNSVGSSCTEHQWVEAFNEARQEYQDAQNDSEWDKAKNRVPLIERFSNKYWEGNPTPLNLDCDDYGIFVI